MLVLARKNRQSVVVGGYNGLSRILKVTVLGIRNGTVRLGFDVDPEVSVVRLEALEQRIQNETASPIRERNAFSLGCLGGSFRDGASKQIGNAQ